MPNQADPELEEDFSFDDIPILGKDSRGSSESFTFESFDAKESTIGTVESLTDSHLNSFQKMLEVDCAPGGEDEEVNEDILTPEFLEKQRQKWAQTSKRGGKSKLSMKKLGLVAVPVLLVGVIGACGYVIYLTIFSDDGPVPIPNPPVINNGKKPPVKNKTVVKNGKQVLVKNGGKTTKKPDKGKIPVIKKGGPKKGSKGGIVSEKPNDKKSVLGLLSEIKKLAAQGEEADLEKVCDDLLKTFPNNLAAQIKAQNYLLNSGRHKICEKVYNAWLSSKPDSPVANYLYGRALSVDAMPLAIKYLKKAIQINPKMPQPYLFLGKIYTWDRDWDKAKQVYGDFLKLDPQNSQFKYQMALTRIRAGEGMPALTDYSSFLTERKDPEGIKALKLILLSQRLGAQGLSEKYLHTIDHSPPLNKEFGIHSIRQKAFFGEFTDKDFGDFYPNEVRLFHIIHLLTSGQEEKVKLLPTPPEEYPDFWKAYVSWKTKSPNWQEDAKRIVEAYRHTDNKIYAIIAAVWLETLSADNARKLVNEINPDQEPLFYLMLAEYYKRKKNKMKAKILYTKANKNPHTPYRILIKHLGPRKKKRRKRKS